MKDRFDEMMEKFLIPISKLGGQINDSTYFLRKDGCFVFAQGYCHPPGAISGKIIYYPKKGGWVDIFGREYGCMHKSYQNGKMRSYTNPEQIEKHHEIFPELSRRAPIAPIIKNNLLFPLSEFVGFFDPRKSLEFCMELYPKIRKGIMEAGEILGVSPDRMGLTGSLQYGRLEQHDDDTDIIFYGTVEENYSLMQRILRIVQDDPKRHVHEFGKFWPLRFYNGGILVCPFFVYARRDEIPILDCSICLLKKKSVISGAITDIRHSIYMPLVLPLEGATVDGERQDRFTLIVADSYVRGEFNVGQRIRAVGEFLQIQKGGDSHSALLAANNWDVKTVSR